MALVVGILVPLAACSAPSGGGGEAKTLTVLSTWGAGTPSRAFLDAYIADFEKKSGVKVKVTDAGEDLPTVYETSVVGGEEADVVFANIAAKTAAWADEKVIEPASKYIGDWGLKDRIKPAALEEWTNAKGEVIGFPYSGFVWPVWYNMDLLAKAGVDKVPQTVDELYAATDALRAAGIPPVVVGGLDWSGHKLMLQIAQSYLKADEAKKIFTSGGWCASPAAMKGLKLFVQMRDRGVFVKDVEGYTADQMNSTFYAGKAAIMPAGNWAFADTPPGLKVTLGGFPLPSGSAFDKPTAYQGYTSTGIWISPNGAKNIDVVKQFVTGLYDSATAAKFVGTANSPTAVVLKQDVDVKDPLLQQATNKLPDRVDFAVLPDAYVGALADQMTRESSAAYASGDAAQICAAFDALYK